MAKNDTKSPDTTETFAANQHTKDVVDELENTLKKAPVTAPQSLVAPARTVKREQCAGGTTKVTYY